MNQYHLIFLISYFFIVYSALRDDDFSHGAIIKSLFLSVAALVIGVIRGIDKYSFFDLLMFNSDSHSINLWVSGGLSFSLALITALLLKRD